MRSSFLWAVIILLCTPLFTLGNNSDSLIELRNAHFQELKSFQTSLNDSSTESLLPLLQKMNNFISKDSELLESLGAEIALQDSAIIQSEIISDEYETAKKELAKYEEYKLYAMIGGGGLILLFLIIIIIQVSSKGKLKKKVKKLKKEINSVEEKDSLIQKLKEDIKNSQNDQKLASEKEAKNHTLAIQKKDEELSKLKLEIDSSSTSSEEFKKIKAKISEKDLKISSLEREINAFNREKENQNSEADRLKKQLEDITEKHLSQLEEKEKLYKELQEDAQKIRREKNELEVEMIQYRTGSNTQNNNELEKLKSDLERAEKELFDNKSTLTKEVEALKVENEEIRQKLETEMRIREEFVQKQNDSEENSISIEGNDLEQLKKELAEERQLRLEMQQLMEQLLKKE